MISPWIVRLLLVVLAVEAGVCVAFLTDFWRPLRQREESLFRAFLTITRNDEHFVLDPVPPASRMRIIRPLQPGRPQPCLLVGVTEDPEREFESYPLSPVDWAVILNNAHEAGCRVAAIVQPLSWEDAGELRLSALETHLSRFDSAVLTVDLRRAPTAQTLPPYLKRSAVPLRQLRGNPGVLPRVNRVALPPSATSVPNALFSFRVLESEQPSPGSAAETAMDPHPAFARWDDYLIPSFPVAVAMAQHHVRPSEVRIVLDHHIRLGNGPSIPINEYAQLDFRPLASAPHRFLAANELVQPTGASALPHPVTPRCALFCDATPENPAPWTRPANLGRLVSSIDALPRPAGPREHHRLPPAFEALLFTLIAVIAASLTRCGRLTRFLAFGLLLTGSLVVLAALFELSDYWTPLGPVLATAAAGWFLCARFTSYLPPSPGHSASS